MLVGAASPCRSEASCGIDGSWKQEKIGYILDLIPYSTEVIKKSAFCTVCAGKGRKNIKAWYSSKLKQNGKIVDVVIDVGSKDKYTALCKSCLIQNKNT